MKVKELIEKLKKLDQEKEIGIIYQDPDVEDAIFPSSRISIQDEKSLLEEEKIRWRNNGYYMS